jgi:hypothetical protein
VTISFAGLAHRSDKVPDKFPPPAKLAFKAWSLAIGIPTHLVDFRMHEFPQIDGGEGLATLVHLIRDASGEVIAAVAVVVFGAWRLRRAGLALSRRSGRRDALVPGVSYLGLRAQLQLCPSESHFQ